MAVNDPRFERWDKRLHGEPVGKPHTDQLDCGYYRVKDGKGANARWAALGVYPNPRDDKEILIRRDGRPYANDGLWDIMWFAEPIPYQTYYDVVVLKKPWPDTPPAADIPAADRTVTRSDNEPPDPLGEKVAQLAEEKHLVDKFLTTSITTQEEADKAAEFASRVAALGKWFSSEYERHNRPLLERQKKLRADYLRRSEEALELAGKLTRHQTSYLVERQKKLDDERKALEARVAAEQRAAAQAVAAAAPAEGSAPAPTLAPAALPLEAPKRAASGGLTSRKTTLRTQRVAKITDYRVLAAFLITGGQEGTPRDECRNPDLRDVLDKIAARMAKNAIGEETQPGFTVVDEPVARR